jgi:hypothetical protein
MLDVPLQILLPQVMEMRSTEWAVVYGQLNSPLMRKSFFRSPNFR